MTFAKNIDLVYKVGFSVLLLIGSIYLHQKEKAKKYGEIVFLFFVASIAILISSLIGNWGLLLFGLDTSGYVGQSVAKFSESLPIIIVIIAFIKFVKPDFKSIYLTKGKLKSGLIIGGSFFFTFTFITIIIGAFNPIFKDKLHDSDINTLIAVIPWALLFVLTNGFMEELLFRGLFLKHFESIIGFKSSNILTAIIFSIAHIQVTYVTHMVGFIIIVFILGLLLGHYMKKTNSIIAPMLIHAGADMMMILPSFVNLT
jgi:membrane protease YdiL (CAAX protease family)